MHNGLLTKDGKKISKSDPGTIVLMSDLLDTHEPDTLRALILTSHYRRPIDYGPSRLDELKRGPADLPQGDSSASRPLTGTPFDQLTAPARRSAFDPGRIAPARARSPNTAAASSRRWTTTSTPAAPSASSSTWSTP